MPQKRNDAQNLREPTVTPKVTFTLQPVPSLARLEAGGYAGYKADGQYAVLSMDLDPHSRLVNGWEPGSERVALLVEDNEWNPLVAKVPDDSGRWGVIGGAHFLESVIMEMEHGPMQVPLNWRVWTFAQRPVAEFCELMRVYFNRRRLQVAKYRHHQVPSYQGNPLAGLSSEAFLDEAVAYHQAVYAFWEPFTR